MIEGSPRAEMNPPCRTWYRRSHSATIRLRRRTREPRSRAGWSGLHAMTGPCRVVICDDVLDFRALISTALQRSPGLVVAGEAGNGREAIEVARKERPDVVLLDIAMPVMDGMEALPLIRQASPTSKVIMLTGFAGTELKAQALNAGAVAYIEKGALPAAIIQAVRAACSAG